jgi:hypothetical protein
MSISAGELEAALSDLRANDNREHIPLIANYPAYHVLLTDKGMPTAPDSKGRKLGAIFTSEAALEAFRERIQPGEAHPATVPGPDIFPQFRDMQLEGIVFNCCGPQPALAFIPEFLDQICDHLGVLPDFDSLATAAFPGNQLGPMPALDALWTAVLSLRQWIFPVNPTNRASPFYAIYEDHRCAFAFTDADRLLEFCKANNLPDEYITMPLPGVLDWVEESTGEFEVLQFNLGGIGWFCPVQNLAAIRKRLRK